MEEKSTIMDVNNKSCPALENESLPRYRSCWKIVWMLNHEFIMRPAVSSDYPCEAHRTILVLIFSKLFTVAKGVCSDDEPAILRALKTHGDLPKLVRSV
jgi:hypothetical protein